MEPVVSENGKNKDNELNPEDLFDDGLLADEEATEQPAAESGDQEDNVESPVAEEEAAGGEESGLNDLEADDLFLDLDSSAPVQDEQAAPAVESEAAADSDLDLSEEDDLLGAVEIELSPEEQAEIERRGRMRWFVIHANTGHENKVKRNIEMAIRSNHMEEYFGEILVATQEVAEMKNGKRVTSKRKFFPATSWSR
jgi:transcriptional antiterminator NusG